VDAEDEGVDVPVGSPHAPSVDRGEAKLYHEPEGTGVEHRDKRAASTSLPCRLLVLGDGGIVRFVVGRPRWVDERVEYISRRRLGEVELGHLLFELANVAALCSWEIPEVPTDRASRIAGA
jgi:hypothetical protein